MRQTSILWDYQPHFRAALQAAAEQIFLGLAPDLSVHAHLVGLGGCLDGGSRVVLDPPHLNLSEGVLAECVAVARDLIRIEELPEELHHRLSDPSRRHGEGGLRQLRDMVQEVLSEQANTCGLVAFVAPPVRVGTAWVFVTLTMDRSTYTLHTHHHERVGEALDVAGDLVDAVISEFLSAGAKALTEKAPGSKPIVFEREPHELLRTAATTLLYRRTYALRKWGYPVDLFEVCNEISSMMYEGHEGRGSMIVAQMGDPRVEVFVELQNRVPLTDHRAARKLLEMATEHLDLLTDAGYIYGLGRLRELEDGEASGGDYFRIDFIKHFAWELLDHGHSVMQVSYGRPSLRGKPISEQRFREDVQRIFGHVEGLDVDTLWEVALATTRQRRGTMLLISEDAASEAQRLRNQCIPVRPVRLTPRIVETMTAIDGALMTDPSATCHAIGVILDGLANERETASRGARYNSAVRYVHTMSAQFRIASLAIVVSTDGMVDLVPKARPGIDRTHIEHAIDALHRLARQRDDFDAVEYIQIVQWFDAHRLHLHERDAIAINAWIDAIRPRLEPDDARRANWARFVGNPDLDSLHHDYREPS